MIAHVAGSVAAVSPEGAVIEVGGVGLLVQCTPGTLAGLRPGEHARVATSLVVREDSLTLYGFASEDERNTFELLQTASGVGPRLAQAMLAVLTPDALRRAVAAEDLATLTSVPGIGRKGAQRIVLELAGRLGPPGDGVSRAIAGQSAAATQWRDQVRAGLVSLGWQAREADEAIAAVEPELTGQNGAAGANGAGGQDSAGGQGRAAGQDSVGQNSVGQDGAVGQESAAGSGGGGQGGGGRDGGVGHDTVDVAVALRAALRVLGRP